MRILLDECVNPRVKAAVPTHEVQTVAEKNWKGLKNGELLDLAEQELDVFVTIDQSLQHQQNIRRFRLGIIVVRVPDDSVESYQPIFTELNHAAGSVRTGALLCVVSPSCRP